MKYKTLTEKLIADAYRIFWKYLNGCEEMDESDKLILIVEAAYKFMDKYSTIFIGGELLRMIEYDFKQDGTLLSVKLQNWEYYRDSEKPRFEIVFMLKNLYAEKLVIPGRG